MTVQYPKTAYEIVRSRGFINITEHQVLFIGQKTDEGTAVDGALETEIQHETDINNRFGKTSQIAQMLRAARKINTITKFDAIALDDDVSGVSATADLVFSGTATEDGELTVEVVSGANNSYTLEIVAGDNAAAIAGDLRDLMILDEDAPFTVVFDTIDTLTFTAENEGTIANKYLLRSVNETPGLDVIVVPWSGGSNDPDITTVFDVVGDERYQTIVFPGSYDDEILTNFLNPRFNSTKGILDGVGIITRQDTFSNLITFAEAINSQSVVLIGNKSITALGYIGSHLREMNDVISAQFAAVRSLRLTEGADLKNIVVTPRGDLDLVGGIALASLPYANTPIDDIPVALINTYWSEANAKELKLSGVSLIGPNPKRTGTICDQAVTTNTVDELDNPNDEFLLLNTIDTSVAGREFQHINITNEFIQSRLTDGDLIDGFSMENEDSIRALTLRFYEFLSNEVPLYRKGAAATNKFTESLIVEVNLTPSLGFVIIDQTPPLVGQLGEIRGKIRVDTTNI